MWKKMKDYFNKVNDLPAFFYSVIFKKKKVNEENTDRIERLIEIDKRNSKQIRVNVFYKTIHPLNLDLENE